MSQINRRTLLSSFAIVPALSGLSACGKAAAPADILRVGLGGGPDSLDPLKAEFAAAALLFRQFYLPVVGYGPKAGPAPGFATSWTPSNNNKTWTFEIAQGLTWSDGKAIDSKDVLDSLRLGADKKTAYADASELYMIKGYRDCVVDGKDPTTIGVSAPNPTTLVVELDVSDAAFWSRMQEFYPVPMHTIAAHGEKWTELDKIVVSGPYKPVERSQTRLVFNKNPMGGWVEGMPGQISVEAIEDSSTRLRMFQSGDLDLAQDPPLLRAADFAKEFGNQYQRFEAPRLVYMSFNTKKPQFQDPDIRRALAMGFDRSVIANAVMRGSVEPAGRYVRGQAQPKYDPEGARAILSAKGFSATNPLRFELLVTKDDRERAAIQMVDMWKQIGVEATMFAADSSAIVSRLNGFDFEAAIVRIDKGMKSDAIDLMASWGEGGTAYSHQWKDPAFNQALLDARAESEPAARLAKTLAAEDILMKACPVTGVWFFPSSWLVSERVTGGIEGIAPIIWPSLKLTKA
ncbi:OppA ABC-type oligopeptide transport system, periplasmic component [Caulobacteraceae bacterium]